MAACPACRAENLSSASFCAACGARLAVSELTPVPPTRPSKVITCSACGAHNSGDHTFCGECGQRLADEDTTPIPGPPSGPAVSAPSPTPPRTVPPTRLAAGTVCSSCGTFNPEDDAFCRECGAKLAASCESTEGSAEAMTTPPLAAKEPTLPPTRLAQGTVCPSCGTFNTDESTFCRECGSSLEPPEEPAPQAEAAAPATSEKLREDTTCPQCGSINPTGQRFCGQCGNPLSSIEEQDKRTRRLVSPQEPEGARILILLPDGDTKSYPLETDLTIGRDEGDIRLPGDDYLSGTHARVSRDGERYVLHDLDSTNGTFVRLRSEIPLRPGDYVMVGDQVFRFVL